MTRSELIRALRLMTSGTVAVAIGCDKYAVIDRAVINAVLYASEKASDAEIAAINDLSDTLSFLTAHKDYTPSWCN